MIPNFSFGGAKSPKDRMPTAWLRSPAPQLKRGHPTLHQLPVPRAHPFSSQTLICTASEHVAEELQQKKNSSICSKYFCTENHMQLLVLHLKVSRFFFFFLRVQNLINSREAVILIPFTREIYNLIGLQSQDFHSSENDVARGRGVKEDVGDNILGPSLSSITPSQRNIIGFEAQLLLPPSNPPSFNISFVFLDKSLRALTLLQVSQTARAVAAIQGN